MHSSKQTTIAWRKRAQARNQASAQTPIQSLIEAAVASETKTSRLMARLFAKKLKKQGALAIDRRLDELEAQIQKQLLSGYVPDTFVFEDGFPEQREGLDLQFTTAELDEFSVDIATNVERLTEDAIEAIFVATLTAVREQTEEAVQRRVNETDAFQRRLALRWNKPLQLLSVQIGLSAQFGEQMNDWLRSRAGHDNSTLVDVLTRLHARATQVAAEIERLLLGGFADGAISRWRTLHELTIVAIFVSERGSEVATRYCEHLRVDSLRTARRINDVAFKLGWSPISDHEFSELQAEVAALKLKFGKSFGTEYGWAADALEKQDPTFTDIEAAVKLDRYRPYFKLASDNVHAGPKGTFHRLGLAFDRAGSLLAGPSNAGLEEAGRLTALSLGQIASSLISLHPVADGIIWMRVIGQLGTEIQDEFIIASRKLKQNEHGHQESRLQGKNGLRCNLRR